MKKNPYMIKDQIRRIVSVPPPPQVTAGVVVVPIATEIKTGLHEFTMVKCDKFVGFVLLLIKLPYLLYYTSMRVK